MAGTDPASPLIFQRFMGSVPKFSQCRKMKHGTASADGEVEERVRDAIVSVGAEDDETPVF